MLQTIFSAIFGKTSNPICFQLQLLAGLISAATFYYLINETVPNIPDVTNTFGLGINTGIVAIGFLIGSIFSRALIETGSLYKWAKSSLKKCRSKNNTQRIRNGLSETVEKERLEIFITIYNKLQFSTQKTINEIIKSTRSFNPYDEAIEYLSKNQFISIKATLEDDSNIYEIAPYLVPIAKEKWIHLIESHYNEVRLTDDFEIFISAIDTNINDIDNKQFNLLLAISKKIDSINVIQIPSTKKSETNFGDAIFKIELESTLQELLSRIYKNRSFKKERFIAYQQHGFEFDIRFINV
jgi:hypothetical protein